MFEQFYPVLALLTVAEMFTGLGRAFIASRFDY